MARPLDDALYHHLESRLMSRNVYLVAAGVVDDTLELAYETVMPEGGVDPRQVGSVVVVLREFDDWEPRDVAATVTNADGVVHGTWHVEEAWLRDLESGDLTEEEFSALAIDAIRSWGPRGGA
jgi:hypothetical protein